MDARRPKAGIAPEYPVPSMTGRICVVTGANRGIGREVARGLVQAGAHVLLVSRSPERGEEAVRDILGGGTRGSAEVRVADLASQASVRSLAARIRSDFPRLHLLVNNAAVVTPRRQVTADGLETQFAVNHLAPFLLTRMLLEPLRRGAPSRIVNVASRAHVRAGLDPEALEQQDLETLFRCGTLRPSGRYGRSRVYARTKLANVLFTFELDRRLREGSVDGEATPDPGRSVTVNAVHPGVIATGLLGGLLGPLSAVRWLTATPARGAEPVLRVAMDPVLAGVSGEYFNRGRRVVSSPASRSRKLAGRLWEASERACGLPSPSGEGE